MAATQDTSALPKIIIGCRKSELALIQARDIVTTFNKAIPNAPSFEVATKSVVGDADKTTPFLLLSKQTGGSDVGKSLWTNGLEEELVAGRMQMLVHCLKDMPTTLPPNCKLVSIPERADTSDAVIMKTGSEYTSIDQLPPGSVVGSSSSRRRALIKRNWPHLEVEECRGNVDTRLSKLDAADSKFSCILLATAGLVRLNLGHRITQRLKPDVFPYAVGQGALGIEVESRNENMAQVALAADHTPSRWRGLAERAMLRSLQGGCSSPIGVDCTLVSGDSLRLFAMVLSVDGSKEVTAEQTKAVKSDDDAEQLGVELANILLDKGAANLLVREH